MLLEDGFMMLVVISEFPLSIKAQGMLGKWGLFEAEGTFKKGLFEAEGTLKKGLFGADTIM